MEDKYLSVSSLNKYIKYKFDSDDHLQEVYLKGEISNFKSHSSGHYYFSLKDSESRIKAIMFKSSALKVPFSIVDGMNVLVSGKVSIYSQTGEYQITINNMYEDGLGSLYIAFTQMKEKLEAEGLFLESNKKKIPLFPKRVGVITASTGAAIRDVITTIKRRFPICEVIVFPTLVQGDNAKFDIVKNIEKAESYNLDTLIVGRGGGSIEDLWPFNEEIVARAIFNSSLPIISAVGHETDFTIADFVASLRAPTPTAAAELAVPDVLSLKNHLNHLVLRGNKNIKNIVEYKKISLKKLSESYILKNPYSMYEVLSQRLDSLVDSLNKNINNKIEVLKLKLFKLSSSYILSNPKLIYDKKLDKLNYLINKCEILNPLSSLKRGYAIVKKDDIALSNIDNIKSGDIIKVNMQNGYIVSNVLEVEEL